LNYIRSDSFVLPRLEGTIRGWQMKLLQLAACAFGKHYRDRKRAWHDGQRVRSYCGGCGKPMIRELGGWRAIAAHPAEPSGEQEAA